MFYAKGLRILLYMFWYTFNNRRNITPRHVMSMIQCKYFQKATYTMRMRYYLMVIYHVPKQIKKVMTVILYTLKYIRFTIQIINDPRHFLHWAIHYLFVKGVKTCKMLFAFYYWYIKAIYFLLVYGNQGIFNVILSKWVFA